MTWLILTILQSLFAKTYGGASQDLAYSIAPTAEGGYVIAGYTSSFGAGNCDFLVIKLGPDGSLSWARTYGGPDDDRAFSVIQTSDQGYLVGGYTRSFGAGASDFLVIKLEPDGSLSWARTYGGTSSDEAHSLTQTSDGGYALAGNTISFGGDISGSDLILRLNPDGSIAWARTFGATNYVDTAYSIIQTSDGGYAVTGHGVFSLTGFDIFVLKLNSDGSPAWGRAFSTGDYNDFAYSIAQTADGGLMVAGESYNFGTYPKALLLKLNPDGSLSWAKAYGGSSFDHAYSLIQTADGGYVLAGSTGSFGAGNDDALLIKLNSDASVAWGRTVGGGIWEYASSVIQNNDGGFAVAGRHGDGVFDIFAFSLDTSGNYPGCAIPCNPIVSTPSISVFSVSGAAPCSPDISVPNLSITAPSLTITDMCPPLNLKDRITVQKPGITCHAVPGGLVFVASEEVSIRMYKPDGRLVYSGELRKGETRIGLEQGVYLWQVTTYKGKAIVR